MRLFVPFAALCFLASCAPESGAALEELADQAHAQSQALFTNGDFETNGLSGWTVSTFRNSNGGPTVLPPTTVAHLNLASGNNNNFTFARNNNTPESQAFSGMTLDPAAPKWPKFGTTSAVVNEQQGANSTSVNSLKQSYTLTNADVDPADNKVHVRFVLAPALQAAGHIPREQPYFFVILRNTTTGATLFTDYNFANNPGTPWRAQGTGNNAVLYTDWVIYDIAPGNVAMRVGQTIELEVFASRCNPSGHFGEVYVDGFGANLPGLSINKTAVQATNVDGDLAYDFVVQNNSTAAAPGVVASETLPFGTTFVSSSTSTPGASCTSLAVGATGTITCNFGLMNPGAVGRFRIVVHAFGAVAQGTATGGTATTLVHIGAGWVANAYAGHSVFTTGGTGGGQFRTVLSNDATTLTVAPAWSPNPGAGTQYKIVNPPRETGSSTAAAGTGNTGTVTDGTQAWTENQWVASTVTVLSGTGAGQQRIIVANTATELTVAPGWTTVPPNGSAFAIGLPPDQVVNGDYSVRGTTISPVLGPRVSTAITSGVTYSDLAVTVSNGTPGVTWGMPVTYTITVTNNGPNAVTGATVTDTLPPELTGAMWTCVGASGGTCPASGSGNIAASVNLPPGASVTFTLTANVVAGSGTGQLVNTASVAPPAGVTDSDTRNNSDADVDGIGTLFRLTVDKAAGATGQGTVTSSPVAIACGNACTTANADFLSGTVVTLTAVARPGDTFVGWTGACTGSSITCNVTVDAAKTVTATFRGPLVTGTAGTGGTITCTPAPVAQGQSTTCTATPSADYELAAVTDNGNDVTSSVTNNAYTLTNLMADHTVNVTFNRKPVFTSTAPTVGGQGVAYTYNPTATDVDGPGPLVWSRDPADTCGGTVAANGAYTVTPGTQATCVVGIRVCDSAPRPACRTQLTTVTINHPPVANGDAVSTGVNTQANINSNTLTSNDNAGGDAAEQAAQTVTITAVSATSANGGTVTQMGNVVRYTPPAGFTGIDTFTYTITDSGNPALSSTGTVTVSVGVSNMPPVFTSTAPTSGTEGTVYTYTATATDPDGPMKNWSVGAADTCGGTIGAASGVYTFTPAGPVPPATCIVSVRVCDAGTPEQCATQNTTVTITAVNNAPTVTSTPSATATIDVPFNYTAVASDPDGPAPGMWSVAPTDTCGGTINSSTGAYTFTPRGPNAPATCQLSVRYCDGGTPAQCVTQTTTVTIGGAGNQPPVINSTAPTAATFGTAYVYDATATDPDGPMKVWAVGPGDTCGGSINAASGRYTFTPAAGSAATCVVSVRVCDMGAPNQCATQTTTVNVSTAMNRPPSFTSMPPATGKGGTPYRYTPVIADPDGPGQTWERGADDTCGGTVSPTDGIYQFTPNNPPPAPSCVVSLKVCDNGAPNGCTTQKATVSLVPSTGFEDGVGAAGGGCGGCGSSGGLLGFAAVLWLARRRRMLGA